MYTYQGSSAEQAKSLKIMEGQRHHSSDKQSTSTSLYLCMCIYMYMYVYNHKHAYTSTMYMYMQHVTIILYIICNTKQYN